MRSTRSTNAEVLHHNYLEQSVGVEGTTVLPWLEEDEEKHRGDEDDGRRSGEGAGIGAGGAL